MVTLGQDNSIQDTDPGSSVPARPEPGGSFHEGPSHQQNINGRNVEPGQVENEVTEPLRLECGCTVNGRALIVCLDGTPNQFSKNNTNVFELYRRVIKNENQLTYYDRGISGTYPKPSQRSFAYWKQIIFNKIDMAIAWNFKKVILGAYRWLSANYKEGDKIYLFGFSRGAYQVRVLAAMISKVIGIGGLLLSLINGRPNDQVGLILPGNEEQIPFAYKLYADHKSDRYITQSANETFDMAARFKATSSRGGRIQVHYLGVWDTVSSVGVARSKSLPLMDKCEHFCYMRHALALDERRVNLLPQYARGSKLWDLGPERRLGVDNWRGVRLLNNPLGRNRASVIDKPNVRPRVKEVWFAGSHSDIGGGTKSNTQLNHTTIPALWMGNEAMSAGLDLAPSGVAWNWKELEVDRPTESQSFMWRIFEALPLKHLSYSDAGSTHRRSHLANPRKIQPGQKIHASVAFMRNYHPKTRPPTAALNGWHNFIGQGSVESLKWAHALGDLLELNLFDHSDIPNIMVQLNNIGQSHTKLEPLGRLAFMVGNGGEARGDINDPQFETLLNLLGDGNNDAGVKIATCNVLAELVAPRGLFSDHPKFSTLFDLLNNNGDAGVKIAARNAIILVALRGCGHHLISLRCAEPNLLFDLLDDRSINAGVKIATCGFLRDSSAVWERWIGPGTASYTRRLTILCNLLNDKDCDSSVKIAARGVLTRLGESYGVSLGYLESLFNLLDNENNDAGMKIAICNIIAPLTHESYPNPGPELANNTRRLNILFNLLDNKHSGVGMKIAVCSILAGLARNGYIFGDDVTAPVIYRLIVDPNVKLRIAALETLGGFRRGSIPPKVLATIYLLVMPRLIDGTKEDQLSATLALCSCIHEPKFFHGITKDLGIPKLIDILAGYLWQGGPCPGTIVRGLVGLIEYGELPQQVIAQQRIALAIVYLFDEDRPNLSRGGPQAGVQGALAFSQSDILRASLRGTSVLDYLSKAADWHDSDWPTTQRDALLALEALVQDDILAKEALELITGRLPQQIWDQLKSDPRMSYRFAPRKRQNSHGSSVNYYVAI